MSTTATSLPIAVRLHLARTNRTQTWLAAEAGLRTRSLMDRLNGHSIFRIDEVDAIAAAFGMSTIDLVKLADDEADRERVVA